MVSSFTPNLSLEKPANGDYVDTWSTPVNADWDAIALQAAVEAERLYLERHNIRQILPGEDVAE